jgi:hypothetical protein
MVTGVQVGPGPRSPDTRASRPTVNLDARSLMPDVDSAGVISRFEGFAWGLHPRSVR